MNASLKNLLRANSRSVYLSLRILPASLGPQIGLAYLLARMTDTIADTEIVSVEQRLAALQSLRERILGQNQTPLDFGALAAHQGHAEERLLLEHCEDALAELEKFSAADQQRIREVLEVITSGQELDLKRFAGASEKNIIALQSAAELDDYTYRVAGCVGEFWTKMCRAHLFPNAAINDAQLLANGVRFGKGLQLVNILRDLPRDLRQGRCYIPIGELKDANLSPTDLLDAANMERFRPIYSKQLAQARDHLRAGWEYTNTLPWRCMRVRLACAWLILIGIRTLNLLVTGNVLNASRRLKVPRSQVYGIILKTVVLYPLAGLWRGQFSEREGA